jgi:hypothetical protein
VAIQVVEISCPSTGSIWHLRLAKREIHPIEGLPTGQQISMFAIQQSFVAFSSAIPPFPVLC